MIGGAIALALVITWLIVKKQPHDHDHSAQPQQEERRSPRRAKDSPATQPATSNSSANTAQRNLSPSQPPLSQVEVDQILEDLYKASITYDASELPKIDPYLLHSNPEIRKAALNAMINLGDASAGPLLRIAAAKAPTPHEAVALLDAAEYVELPPAKLKFKKKAK